MLRKRTTNSHTSAESRCADIAVSNIPWNVTAFNHSSNLAHHVRCTKARVSRRPWVEPLSGRTINTVMFFLTVAAWSSEAPVVHVLILRICPPFAHSITYTSSPRSSKLRAHRRAASFARACQLLRVYFDEISPPFLAPARFSLLSATVKRSWGCGILCDLKTGGGG